MSAACTEAVKRMELTRRRGKLDYRAIIPGEYPCAVILRGEMYAENVGGGAPVFTDLREHPAGICRKDLMDQVRSLRLPSNVFFATAQDEPIGFIYVFLAENHVGYLAELYVRKPYRGRGAGLILLSMAISWALDFDCVEVVGVPLSDRARAFFRAHGFRDDGRRVRRTIVGLGQTA